MKVIMVMFDSLNRHFLPPYGCEWVHAPNFERLRQRTVTFDQSFVGSMPCMPARRDLHTGRYNFLHRSWGPLEPYDLSFVELLRKAGVYTHLVTDHQHYWEDGGCTYHNRYNTYEFVRGQEGDLWKGEVDDVGLPDYSGEHPSIANMVRQDWINRKYCREEHQFPQALTFEAGLQFIETNKEADRWFLQLETFDPHEPFYAPERFRALYAHDYEGPHFDWPRYRQVTEPQDRVDHVRKEYAALVSMCDIYLGKVLDKMDELELWRDTMLIVNTDHGFFLGEHGWWAKCVQPFFNEVAHTPLFVWDPRSGKAGERCGGLVQNIDIAPTLLDLFGLDIPDVMTGELIGRAIEGAQSNREAVLFGIHGGHINVTDGRYVYMRAPARADNQPLYNYTLMPTHMRSFFGLQELTDISLAPPFDFTQGLQSLKVPSRGQADYHSFGTVLYDLETDPGQFMPIQDAAVESRMIRLMKQLMKAHDAPSEQFMRMGLIE